MIRIIAAVGLFTLLGATTCRKEAGDDRLISASLGACAQSSLGGVDISVCYDTLYSDSRCPIGVQCGWSGVGEVGVRVRIGSQEHLLRLATLQQLPQYRRDTIIQQYQITLSELLPYPGANNSPQQVTLFIQR